MKKYYLIVINPFEKGKPKEVKTPLNEDQIKEWLSNQTSQTLDKCYIYGFMPDSKGKLDVKCFHYANDSFAFINDTIDKQVKELLSKQNKSPQRFTN